MSIQIKHENTKITNLDFTEESIRLIKNTVAKNCTDLELQLFLHTCRKSGLDPLIRQIYAIKRKSKGKNGEWEETMTIQSAIDGLRLIGERTGKYAPGREPTYEYDENKNVVSATAYVKKMTPDGTWHEVAATAFYDEYVQTNIDYKLNKAVPTSFWKKMPKNQLAKCAEALALRKAFPNDMSGIYSMDEMGQADNPEPVVIDANLEIKIQEEPKPQIDNNPRPIHESPEVYRLKLEEYLNRINHQEDRPIMESYLMRYASHWKKSMSQTVEDYQDVRKFLFDFNRWKQNEIASAHRRVSA